MDAVLLAGTAAAILRLQGAGWQKCGLGLYRNLLKIKDVLFNSNGPRPLPQEPGCGPGDGAQSCAP